MRAIIAAILIVLLAGCTNQISTKDASRIGILYTHTQLMIQSSDPSFLEQIGMDPKAFFPTRTSEEKLRILEKTMLISSEGTVPQRIERAEQRMNDLMIKWNSGTA